MRKEDRKKEGGTVGMRKGDRKYRKEVQLG